MRQRSVTLAVSDASNFYHLWFVYQSVFPDCLFGVSVVVGVVLFWFFVGPIRLRSVDIRVEIDHPISSVTLSLLPLQAVCCVFTGVKGPPPTTHSTRGIYFSSCLPRTEAEGSLWTLRKGSSLKSGFRLIVCSLAADELEAGHTGCFAFFHFAFVSTNRFAVGGANTNSSALMILSAEVGKVSNQKPCCGNTLIKICF